MKYRYRQAAAGDEAGLARLCGQLGYPSSAEAVARRLGELAGRSDHFVLVAVDEGEKPVGWVHAFVARRVESDTFVEVGGMVVSQSHRGQGIGTELLARAEQWAEGQGVGIVRLRSNVVRERAHVFYADRGYERTKTSFVFQKNL